MCTYVVMVVWVDLPIISINGRYEATVAPQLSYDKQKNKVRKPLHHIIPLLTIKS